MPRYSLIERIESLSKGMENSLREYIDSLDRSRYFRCFRRECLKVIPSLIVAKKIDACLGDKNSW